MLLSQIIRPLACRRQEVTMGIVEQFEEALKKQDLSPGTIQGYVSDLQSFDRWFNQTIGEELPGQQMTEVDILSYRAYLQNQKRFGAATINRKINSIKKFCRWAQSEKIMASNPSLGIKQIKTTKRQISPRSFRRSEINAILREAKRGRPSLIPRNYAIVQLLLQTGIRLRELCKARLENIKIGERSGSILIHGKGNKDREVPLNNSARKAIRAYIKKRGDAPGHLFLSQINTPLSPREVQYIVESLIRNAGLSGRGFSTHTLRHTFSITYLKDHPGDLHSLATLLGHESLDSTAVYTRPSAAELSKNMEESSLNIF